MNTSAIYTSAKKIRQSLQANLEQIDAYLSDGSATTTVIFYGTRNQIVSTRKYSSKWTTSIGKDRVQSMHLNWIDYLTRWNVPAGTTKIKVTSPFVTATQTNITTKVPVSIPMTTVTI